MIKPENPLHAILFLLEHSKGLSPQHTDAVDKYTAEIQSLLADADRHELPEPPVEPVH